MRGTSVSIPISAPVEVVWERLSDLPSHSVWMTDAASIFFLTDQRRGVGVRMKVPTRVGPLRVVDLMEVDEWDELQRIGVRRVGRIGGRGQFRLTGDRNSSVLTLTEQLHFPWYMGGVIAEWFARPILRRVFLANLIRFGRWVETGRTPEG